MICTTINSGTINNSSNWDSLINGLTTLGTGGTGNPIALISGLIQTANGLKEATDSNSPQVTTIVNQLLSGINSYLETWNLKILQVSYQQVSAGVTSICWEPSGLAPFLAQMAPILSKVAMFCIWFLTLHVIYKTTEVK